MPTGDVVLFDIGETLGAIIVDASGRLVRLEVFSYVVPVLERLRADGALLGLISNTGTETAEYFDQILERSGIVHYFAPELRIYSSVVGLRKDGPEIFELAMGRAQRILSKLISNAVFVGESRAERALAVKAGMRSAPHPALARSVLAGGRPVYLLLRVRRDEVQRFGNLFDAAGVVPLRRTDVEAKAEIIALATDIAIPPLQAGGVAVEVLPGPADAAGDDLYLLRDLPKGPAPAAFSSALAADGLRPVLNTRDGVVVALAPHQTIDEFHVGESHGHNLKLLADPTLLFRRVAAPTFAAPAFAVDATLSPEELASLAGMITEERFEEVLRFVTGMDGRPEAVGINRHVLSPQMRAVTDRLMAEFERIGQGAFNVTGHRFEITGRDLVDVRGAPVANRIELDNVIAELPGDSDEAVLVTAHLDSTAAGTFGGSYNPAVHHAPGVDDDGSGVTAVLLIAQFMRAIFAGRKPARTLRFVLFNAEEQGLIGSERYARSQAAAGAKIGAVFQMDMIAYNNSQPNAFEIHAGTSEFSSEPSDAEVERASLAVADLIRRMAQRLGTEGLSILAPAQVLGSPDPASGYSDHDSFQKRGYAACVASEDFFPSPGKPEDRNPNYHKVSDRIVDLPFATSIARVICAAALRVAQPAASPAFAAAAGLAAAGGSAVRVSGHVVAADDQRPPAGATVSLRAGGLQASSCVAQAVLDQDGTFAVEVAPGSYHVVVQAADGVPLASTHETPLAVEADRPVQLLLTVERPPLLAAGEPGNRRTALFADMTLNAAAASEITPEHVLDLARAMISPGMAPFAGRFRAARSAAARSSGSDDDPMRTLCGTERLRAIYRLADLQGYVDPAIVKLKVRDILSMGESGFATKTHVTPNFVISYQTEGEAAVEHDLSDFNVMEPGFKPPRVMATLPGGTVPAYVRLVAFWLERSLQFYTSAPFSMRNPAANGRLSAVINSAPFGGANTDAFYINNALPADLVCAVAVHELFHMVQFSYDAPGPWADGMSEGGATFAEDTVADLMNRYLDEAGANFNGIGLLANPNQSLFAYQARYKSSLFWRYLAEQRSRLVEEPTIGVDTYRRVIEECSANGYTTDSVKRAIRALPFDSEFCTFGYDAGMIDTPASTETTFGNFALACYVKDLAAMPDARFRFRENAENIHIDEVVRLVLPDAPTSETLVRVTREAGRVSPDGPKVVFQSSVAPLANRFFEIEVASDVATVDLDFSAGTAFSGLLQLVVIDENGKVRDLVRTDKRAYRRRLANLVGGQRMVTLAVIVSGGDDGGSFQFSVQSAAAVADVMITRWNSEAGKEYHVDPHGFSWTWVSPDLWFEPAAGGDFAVKVRLRNKGGKRADNVGCVVEYRPGRPPHRRRPGSPFWTPPVSSSASKASASKPARSASSRSPGSRRRCPMTASSPCVPMSRPRTMPISTTNRRSPASV